MIFCAEPFEDRGSDEENSEMKRLQEQSFLECSKELVRQVASPNTNVREQAINLLQVKSIKLQIKKETYKFIWHCFCF